jgi:hypothetical protein
VIPWKRAVTLVHYPIVQASHEKLLLDLVQVPCLVCCCCTNIRNFQVSANR